MVEVMVAKLGLDSSTNSYVVILKEKTGKRLLPIWIGQPEAESIVMQMNGVRRERPITHDLCRNLIVGLGATLRRVTITKVQKNTYFAELQLARGDEIVSIDARPSDSIAVALRFNAPIFAPESLLTAIEAEEEDEDDATSEIETDTGDVPTGGAPDPDELSADQLKAYLEGLRPEDFGKFNL
jgi:bifunctional DNase/RNase